MVHVLLKNIEAIILLSNDNRYDHD